MPRIHILKEHRIENSFRVAQIRGMFDFQDEIVRHEWTSDLRTEEKSWKIGLIVGPSGSGKTTLARSIFPAFKFHEGFEWPKTQSFIDGFSNEQDTKKIVTMLNAVGFSSPPSWLKPFSVLSNGQKFRAELARCILENKTGVVFDEFTSVVDRDVAKIGCAAIEKTIRRDEQPPFVAVSCHYDIIDWLQPDWVFDVGSQCFQWRERRQRPAICLNIRKATTNAWRIFREHHYLNHSINQGAYCYVATWNEKPVAFTSVIHFPHASDRRFKREHRTVVLPDFQGVGIGNQVSEFVGTLFVKSGFRFISTTSAPSMIWHRCNSKKWRMHRFGRASEGIESSNPTLRKAFSCNRITAGFELIA